MGRGASLIGLRFGRLMVIARNGNRGSRRLWLCKCDCGNYTLGDTKNLRNEKKRSCGCLASEVHSAAVKKLKTTHGMTGTKIFQRWQTMIMRCHNPAVKSYKDYGARGIHVCQKWRDNFQEFYADMGEPPFVGATLERINNDMGYFPDNVRWATRKEQAMNKRHMEAHHR